MDGYVLHTYGAEKYLHHAVASVVTLRRYDAARPVALYCSDEHRQVLVQHGADRLFDRIELLPEENRSIVGFKHHLHRFMPFEQNLYVDSDMIWCRDPDPLWTQLSPYAFTATGLERADFFFGGPKGWSVFGDILLDRRTRTLKRFGLTSFPRVQAGMIYAADRKATRSVCEKAAYFLDNREDTHFRSRLHEGRSEETCEWSLAMSMSYHRLPVFPWFQGYNSPQLDFIEGLTDYDPDFHHIRCRYYSKPIVYMIRGVKKTRRRERLFRWASTLPGWGDYMEVTPYVLHFGWLHQKQPFYDFAAREWERISPASAPRPAEDRTAVSNTQAA